MVTEVPQLSVVLLGVGPASDQLDTLRSLLQQTEVRSEVLVDPAVRLESPLDPLILQDPRVRVLGNSPPLDPVTFLERAIAEAKAPYLMVVRSGERLLRGALAAIVEAIADSPGVTLVHSWWFTHPPGSPVSESCFVRQQARLEAFLPPGLRHRSAMLVFGNIVQALPTFRVELLRGGGSFRRQSLDEALHLAVLRVVKVDNPTIIPRLLCGRPPITKGSWDLAGPSPYLTLLAEYHRALREGDPGKLGHPFLGYLLLIVRGLAWRLALVIAPQASERAYLAARRMIRAPKGWRRQWRLGRTLYSLLAAALRRWPFTVLPAGRAPARPIDGSRIGYYRLVFPGETFVRREIEALRARGLHLEVFALGPPTSPFAQDSAAPAGSVTYLASAEDQAGRALLRQLQRTRPWTFLRLYLFAVRHPYRAEKTWERDSELVNQAARLAAAFRSRGITHAHSPFADRGAAHCLLAARLLGITCSVQARASELHRFAETEAAIDRLRLADFVITNSRYNERFLRSALAESERPPIHTIYNGLDLERFVPRDRPPIGDGQALRLLSVGRLIEPKGFPHLLRAIRLARDRGIDLLGEIIGPPREPEETATWLQLRRLRKELGLEAWVHFRGGQPLSRVLEAYREADIFVLACVTDRSGSHDITPNVLLEAMAMGLPVVSTTSGAIPELVENETSGLLVPPGDSEALADAIERLARDPALCERLGRAARRVIEERFDGSRNVEQRLALFGRRG